MRRTAVKLGDVVRAKVISTMNAMIHLSIGEPHLGVIASLCSNCGRPLGDHGRQGAVQQLRERGRSEVCRRLRQRTDSTMSLITH